MAWLPPCQRTDDDGPDPRMGHRGRIRRPAVPASWAAEGHAMRRAIAGDFASLPGVRVMVTLDERFHEDPGPWSTARSAARRGRGAAISRRRSRHYTVLIAPETGGVWRSGPGPSRVGALAGSAPLHEAIELTADKLRLGQHLARRGIATPPCRRVIPSQGFPPTFRYPAVLKPIDGAGSQDTVPGPRGRRVARTGKDDAGRPASAAGPRLADRASFLVGPMGRARPDRGGTPARRDPRRPVHLSRRDGSRLLPERRRGPRRRSSPSRALAGSWVSTISGTKWRSRPLCSRSTPGRRRPMWGWHGLLPGRLAHAWLRWSWGPELANERSMVPWRPT